MNSLAFSLTSANLPEPKISYKNPDPSTSDLQSAMQMAGISVFSIDLFTRKIRFSEQNIAACNIPANQNISISSALNAVQETHREQLITIFRKAFLSMKDVEHEFEVRGTAADSKWLKVTGKFRYTCDGTNGYFLCLLTDVTIKKRNEARRNDLVAMLNHDLRTPLTTIKLYIQMFSKLALKSDHFNASDLLNIASNQVDCMTKMIENFLETTVLESGKIKINRTGFEITEHIRQLIVNEYTHGAKHQFQVNCPDKIWLNADRDKITQVLRNYISNAVKYSPANTSVSILGRKVKNEVIISVKDNGIGISPGDQQKLFSKFFRSETEAVQKIKGFGIGLYLVSDIIEQHQGKVWATSTPGQGSTFYFSLPA